MKILTVEWNFVNLLRYEKWFCK